MALKRSRRTGINPRAYVGVEPSSPPALVSYKRAPTEKDNRGFFVGDLWIDEVQDDIWILVAQDLGVATWIQFGSSSTFATSFVADAGTAVPVSGELNILGGVGLNTAAVLNSVSIGMDVGTDGQVLIGGGAAPVLANITSTGGTLAVTNGPGSINIEAVPTGSLETLSGDTGTIFATGGVVTLAGGTNINTVGGGGAGDELTVNLDDSISLAGTLTLNILGAGVVQTDATGYVFSDNGANGELLIGGGATPAWANITSAGATVVITNGANSINLEVSAGGTLRQLDGDTGSAYEDGTGTAKIAGGTNITTAAGGGAGDEVDISLDNSIALAGTLTLSGLSAGVMQTSAAGVVTSSKGTDGQVLIGGGAAPAWANITSTGSTVAITNGSNSINLEAVGGAPPFLYCQASSGGSGSLGGTGYYNLGSSVALTQIFDDGGNVYAGSGAGAAAYFTAPVTGKYFLNLNVQFDSTNTTGVQVSELTIEIVTSNRTYYHGVTQSIRVPMDELTKKFSVCADMDATDTAQFRVKADLDGDPGTITVKGDVAATPITWISGYLITT